MQAVGSQSGPGPGKRTAGHQRIAENQKTCQSAQFGESVVSPQLTTVTRLSPAVGHGRCPASIPGSERAALPGMNSGAQGWDCLLWLVGRPQLSALTAVIFRWSLGQQRSDAKRGTALCEKRYKEGKNVEEHSAAQMRRRRRRIWAKLGPGGWSYMLVVASTKPCLRQYSVNDFGSTHDYCRGFPSSAGGLCGKRAINHHSPVANFVPRWPRSFRFRRAV